MPVMSERRSAPEESTTTAASESSKRQKIFIACQRCHAHKIKCSGEQPCAECRQVGADDCQYATRDRKVKVNESYLQHLLAENRRLKEQATPSGDVAEVYPTDSNPSRLAEPTDETNTSVRNPLIGDRAWFHPYDPSAPPIFIGEAACTAFATRFRRFLTGKNATAHIPRTQYVKEETIQAANDADVQWPSLQQARLLVKIALRQIGRVYHMLLRKSTLDKLEEIYQTGRFDCPVNQGKFFALFAFGEAYSVRSEPFPGDGLRVPGTGYFARALSLVQILPERTSIAHLETLLLLSLFSYFLNRRHSAYILIGNAMRLSLNIGLNHNIPESQLIDPVERQHRVRIWWTIYIFDRMWGSKMGLPMQILDEDIHVDMPTTVSPPELHHEQFSDTEYLVANVKLARIAGETIAKLYSRRKYDETFLQRVQKLLKALKNWVETLPEHIRLNPDDPEATKKHIVSMHLSFNQCVILATRPTLLHILMKLSERGPLPPPPPPQPNDRSTTTTISQAVLTLGEACIHAARHSHAIIIEKWINSSLPVFGYFHAQYLFSSALVLAMSSLVAIGSSKKTGDLNGFETALEVLRSMSANGNLAAAEFFQNLREVRACLEQYHRETRGGGNSATTTAAISGSGCVDSSSIPASTVHHQNHSIPPLVSDAASSSFSVWNNTPNGHFSPDPTTAGKKNHDHDDVQGGFTTAMAFLEPTMQDFLAQSDLDLGLAHPVDSFMDDAESLYAYLTPSFG